MWLNNYISGYYLWEVFNNMRILQWYAVYSICYSVFYSVKFYSVCISIFPTLTVHVHNYLQINFYAMLKKKWYTSTLIFLLYTTHTHTPHPPPPESTVKSLMPYWYRPNITREEAIDFVRQLESGSFIVRDSQTVSAEIRTCSAWHYRRHCTTFDPHSSDLSDHPDHPDHTT